MPIIAAGAPAIRDGVFLAFAPEPDALAARAEKGLDSALAGTGRLQPAPPQGAILFNGPLAEEWGIVPPEGAAWRRAH